MTSDTSQNSTLREALIAADSESADTTLAQRGQHSLDVIIEHERVFELRVRRIAIVAWSITVAALITAGTCFFLVRVGAGTMVEVARAVFIVAGITGTISLVGAALTSITWLFRSRTPSLTVIERRLAALESIIRARAQAEQGGSDNE